MVPDKCGLHFAADEKSVWLVQTTDQQEYLAPGSISESSAGKASAADSINEHRQYEPVYEQLGFKKVAEWARWGKYSTEVFRQEQPKETSWTGHQRVPGLACLDAYPTP